jgi:hypothetical protein
MASNPLLSVILPQARETELTAEWCLKELKGVKHEIIVADTWADGYAESSGEFVSFLEKDCVLSKGYFKELLKVFGDKPSYRKLAMVTPVLGANSWDTKVYGYVLSPTSVIPSRIKSSAETYLIQIGFIPGALIRRSALGFIAPEGEDPMLESVNLSILFWNHGQRIALNPDVTYVSTDNLLDLAYHIEQPESPTLTLTIEMWHRELIG